jgi:hypothetical protein
MGAAASTAASRPQRPSRSLETVPAATAHPAAAVATLGAPPPPGVATPRGQLFGFFSGRQSRRHLQTEITSLRDDLWAAKARTAAVERDLAEAIAEQSNQGVPRTECIVCMAASVSTVLIPCGHLCLCVACAESMKKNVKVMQCPLCRVPVERTHRVFLPVDPVTPRLLHEEDDQPDDATDSVSSDDSRDDVAADAGVRVSQASGNRGLPPSSHPMPRVYKRPERPAPQHRPASAAAHVSAADDAEVVMLRATEDMVLRPAMSIVRPPPDDDLQTAVVDGTPEPARQRDLVQADFVLPGAYVPSSTSRPNLAATWDGAMRARD